MSANYSVSEGETLHVCAQLLTDIAIERSLVLPVSHQPGSSGGGEGGRGEGGREGSIVPNISVWETFSYFFSSYM